MKEIFLNTTKLEFLNLDLNFVAEMPYFDGGIPAGFPSPANDFQDLTISFDKEVFGSSPSTIFCARVTGSSMEGAGISDNDIIAVDRLLVPQDGDIAVCQIYDEFTLKRLKVEKDCVWLMPENDSFKPIQITDNESFQVWGIVINTLKYHRKRK
ncbi:LexA family protein [Flavobacterium sp.]|uniref:LexA family protein n=1 Tax=Flavobacterium sp. TaxID=239 RepID=UPI003750FE93